MQKRIFIALAGIIGSIVLVTAVAVAVAGSSVDSNDRNLDAADTPVPVSGIEPRKPAGGKRAEPAKSKGPVPTLPVQPRSGPSFAILEAQPDARIDLYNRPGGKLVRSLRPRSSFGSPLVLSVEREQGPWFGVVTPARPNGELGWVRFDPRKLHRYWTRYSLRVLLDQRKLELRYGDRVLGRYVVTIGATENTTPEGRFAVTDALSFAGGSPFYGCCALALSGHQERLPVGWLGGDRIAIHGTPGPVGYAESHGCIRATDPAMRNLFRRVPLGTPVFVKA
jgi:L,D-transpeptidase catalytic domain